MERIDTDHHKLSTGRVIYTFMGLIGINSDLKVTHGSDSDIEGLADYEEDPETHWTPAERAELADWMISLWQQFKRTSHG